MMQLTNLQDYFEYFEQLASQAAFIDFFAFTKEEFDKKSSHKGRGGWCMILEPYDAGIKDNGADSVLSYNTGQFVIAKKKTNEATPAVIENQAQKLAHKILGRMRRDRREGKLATSFENFSLQTINPLGAAGYHGVLVEFNFYYSINQEMKFNEEDWNL